MIAPAAIPPAYAAWNAKHHAPFGRRLPFRGPLSYSRPAFWFKGPFGIQENSETRLFEYPWAYAQISRLPRKSALVEIGGGLSGLQFVLAKEGYDVTNVDPGMAAKGLGFPAEAESHRYLSRVFGAPARLIPTVIEEAGLGSQSVDGILSVSTLEHLTQEDIDGVAESIKAILKPTGVVVLTVDLFLDIHPFTGASTNKWGRNIDIRSFLDHAELKIESGKPEELFGFPEFDARAISKRRDEFLVGASGIALAQCLVASPK